MNALAVESLPSSQLDMLTEIAPISIDQMKLVLDVASLLAMTGDLDTLLHRIATAATTLVSSERASIFLHDPETSELWTKVALGTREIRVPCTAGIVGHVFQTNQTLVVHDPYSDARFNPEPDRRNNFRTRNLLTAPVKNLERKQIGVVQVVNRLGGGFNENDKILIELLADQAGVALQRYWLQQEVVKAAGLRHEMQLAQQVQAALIPSMPPNIPGLSAVGWARPASVTGGDAYDLWEAGDDTMGIFLGDASGHGIAPALVVSQARTLMRALADIKTDPRWLLHRVNERLVQDLEPGRFVTAFAGFASGDGEIRWCSAGHGPMLFRPSPSEAIQILEPSGPPIGVIPDLPCDDSPTVQLKPGGTFIVMSDGIFEARNEFGELFDLHRVVAVLDMHRDAPPEKMMTAVRESVRRWQGKDDPIDDQTLVIIQRG